MTTKTDKDQICKQIKKTCLVYLPPDIWKRMRSKIYLDLAKLQPGRAKDDIPSFIAYNAAKDKPRVKAKTGKFLIKKMNLDDKLCTSVLESLAGEINLMLYGITSTIILYGPDITRAYRDSFGSASCMTGSCCEYTKLYESNPSKFGLFTMTTGNSQARAILHTLDDGSILMDRVYGNNGVVKAAMETHAIKKGWYYHKAGIVYFDGSLYSGKLISSGLSYCEGEVPYMDTLNYADIVNGLLTISNSQGNICLDSTCGTLDQECICGDCGENMSESDACYIGDDYICDYCRDNNYFRCSDCEELYSDEDENFVSDLEIYVCLSCSENYAGCDDCSDTVEALTEIVDKEEYVCDSCLEHYTQCDDCGEYTSETATIDGPEKEVCSKCIDNYPYCEGCCSYVGEVKEDNYCCDCAEESEAVCNE